MRVGHWYRRVLITRNTLTQKSGYGRGLSTMNQKDTYTHGHHESVTNFHAKRTVDSCAKYLVPHLRKTDRLLDVGCGPGSITRDFAGYVESVVGMDNVESVLDLAKDSTKGLGNVTIEQEDIYGLTYESASFDVIHAHQVLQHLADPVGAIREMRRVAKPGGIVAARDVDYCTFLTYPPSPTLDKWRNIYRETCFRNNAQPDAARYLIKWFLDAGFEEDEITFTMSANTFVGQDAIDLGHLYSIRALESDFPKQALKYKLATMEDLQEISKAWKEWPLTKGAMGYYVNGEVIAKKKHT